MMPGFDRGCATLAVVAFTCVVASVLQVSGQVQDAIALESDSAVERRLDRGEVHRYALALSAGEHARLIVEQHGIDVIAQVRSPDEGAIAEFEDEIRDVGQEQVDVVADTPGNYTIAIRAAPGIGAPGSYAIRLASRDSATDSDRALQHSRTLRMNAARLDTQGRYGSRPILARTSAEHHRGRARTRRPADRRRGRPARLGVSAGPRRCQVGGAVPACAHDAGCLTGERTSAHRSRAIAPGTAVSIDGTAWQSRAHASAVPRLHREGARNRQPVVRQRHGDAGEPQQRRGRSHADRGNRSSRHGDHGADRGYREHDVRRAPE